MANKQVLVVIGTRPEAIKMAPVYKALRSATGLEVRLVSTGQHQELLHQAIAAFGLRLDYDLAVMQPGQSLTEVSAAILNELERMFQHERPDLVLVHGDTTSAVCTALWCFYHAVPFAHVEAGLRTHQLACPFPEEFNRQTIARIAGFHFAPTEQAKNNLISEGVQPVRIAVTGNTVLDALEEILPRATSPVRIAPPPATLAVVTLHRRAHGDRFERMLSGVREAALSFPDTRFVYPVHLNPCVRRSAHAALAMLPNVRLVEPMSYADFIGLVLRADAVITDSGGVQEEACHLGRSVLLVRDQTERDDGLTDGCVTIVGSDVVALRAALKEVLAGRAAPRPGGPGARRCEASRIIADIVIHQLLDLAANSDDRVPILCAEAVSP